MASATTATGFWVTFVGVIWIIVMTAICYIGIELSARTQVALLGAEIIILFVFAIIALARVYSGHIAHSIRPSIQWLNPFKIHPIGALSAGMLLAVFIYWGWDTAVTVNEEAKDARRTPGRAALMSTLVLLLIYVVVSFAAQSFHGVGYPDQRQQRERRLERPRRRRARIRMGQAADRLRAHVGLVVDADDHLARGALLAVDGRAQGVPQEIRRHPPQVPVARVLDAVVRGRFGRVVRGPDTDQSQRRPGQLHPRPRFRHRLLLRADGLRLRLLLPQAHLQERSRTSSSSAWPRSWAPPCLTVLFVIAIFYYSDPVNSSTGDQAWLPFIHFNFTFLHQHFYVKKGLGPPLVLGIGLLLIGVPLMLVWMIRNPDFFRRDREVAESVDSPAPPLTAGVNPVTD